MNVKFKDGRVKHATFKQWYESLCINCFEFSIFFSLVIFCSFIMTLIMILIPGLMQKIDTTIGLSSTGDFTHNMIPIIILGIALLFYILILISAGKGFKILIREFAKPESQRFIDNPYLERKYRVNE